MNLLPLTDDKLDEYLGIWNRLIEQGQQKKLEITLQADYNVEQAFRYFDPRYFNPWQYTITYGEERRELTYEQALKVKQWLDRMA